MLNGRERMGPNLGIDWKAVAFGHGKNKRKTVGFGTFDKKRGVWTGGVVHIREVSLMSGGFGAALWDAAIIMARWIFDHGESAFEGKVVHELGCGVGLPGLIAARHASQCIFSDYLPGVLENMSHNISINTNLDFDEESDDEEIEKARHRKQRIIKSSTRHEQSQRSQEDTEEEVPAYEASHTKSSSSEEATASSSDSSDDSSMIWHGSTFNVIDLNWDLVSETCSGSSSFPDASTIPLADIIIGSELTYSPKSVDGLIKTVEKYLKPDGIFYEILSTDRDGVSLFVEMIQQAGWITSVHPVPESILAGKFNTKQRPESYRLYTFRRPSTSPSYPDFA